MLAPSPSPYPYPSPTRYPWPSLSTLIFHLGLPLLCLFAQIDEIHTPDSSRYWLAGSYEQRLSEGRDPEMIDKEFLRVWFREHCDPYADLELPQVSRLLHGCAHVLHLRVGVF